MENLNYNQLIKLVSKKRLDSYEECFPNNVCTDEEKVKKYYENINYCSSLWKDICLIEIALRTVRNFYT